MATSKSRIPICDLHSNEEATVMCLKHHLFMCLDCVVEQKHKLDDCNVKVIGKLFPNEKYLYDLILIRRALTEKKVEVVKHTEQVGMKQEELKYSVEKHYDAMVKKLQERKEESLNDLEVLATVLYDRDVLEIKQIEEIELEIKTNIEKLDDISHGTQDEKLQELHRKEEKLIKEIGPSAIRGEFFPCVLFDNSTKGLGKIEFFDEDSKALASDEYDHREGPDAEKSKGVSDPLDSSIQSSSVPDNENKTENENGIRIPTKTKSPPKIGPKPGKIFLDQGKNEHSEVPPTLSIKEKSDKSFASNVHTKEKSKQGTVPKDVHDVLKPDFEKLKGTTVKLDCGKKVSMPKAVKFTDVITTDLHNIILLDGNRKILLITDFNGQVTGSKHLSSGTVRMVAIQGGDFAMFSGKEIKIYDTSSGGFTQCLKINPGLKNEVTHVTGFDYCCQTKQFAISGLDKNDEMTVVVVKESGEKEKKGQYHQTKPGDLNMIRTTYSFDENRLFCLNSANKSLKCFDCKTNERVWAHRCDDSDFCPRELTLHGNLLYVTSAESIFIFSRYDGESKRKIPTETLLKEIHGICFVDGEQLAVVTSSSDDRDTSLTLGFVSI